ncbi:MAG: hypothetical protein JKY93_03135 [Gammaproteobacteria bacterium]|nr:hypothetical protein [Gammaproteobacteria bacterium]
MSSKSKSSNETKTTNIDKRIVADSGGIVLQTDGSNSTILFEDLNADVVTGALELAGTFIGEAAGIFDRASSTTVQALSNTQALAQNLFEEKNTPSSDNMRNMAYALAAVAMVYFWSKKK